MKTYMMKDTTNDTTTPSIPTISVLNAIAEPALSKLALIIKDGLGVWKKCIRMTTGVKNKFISHISNEEGLHFF